MFGNKLFFAVIAIFIIVITGSLIFWSFRGEAEAVPELVPLRPTRPVISVSEKRPKGPVILELTVKEDKATAGDIQSCVNLLKARLGVMDSNIKVELLNGARIRVRISPEKALLSPLFRRLASNVRLIEFYRMKKEAYEKEEINAAPSDLVIPSGLRPDVDEFGRWYLLEKPALITDEFISQVYIKPGKFGRDRELLMEFNKEGRVRWARITGENTGASIVVVMAGRVYGIYTVKERITYGKIRISGVEALGEIGVIFKALEVTKGKSLPLHLVETSVP